MVCYIPQAEESLPCLAVEPVEHCAHPSMIDIQTTIETGLSLANLPQVDTDSLCKPGPPTSYEQVSNKTSQPQEPSTLPRYCWHYPNDSRCVIWEYTN